MTCYFPNAMNLFLNKLLMLIYGFKKSEMLELEKREAIGLFSLKYIFPFYSSPLLRTGCVFHFNLDLNHIQVKY